MDTKVLPLETFLTIFSVTCALVTLVPREKPIPIMKRPLRLSMTTVL